MANTHPKVQVEPPPERSFVKLTHGHPVSAASPLALRAGIVAHHDWRDSVAYIEWLQADAVTGTGKEA